VHWSTNNEKDNIICKRGRIVNPDDEHVAIINEKGECYLINDTMVSLWNMCRGISFNDLFLEFRRISNGTDEEIKRSLYDTMHYIILILYE
jgi:hypothetical protein